MFIADLGGGYRLAGDACVGDFEVVDEMRAPGTSAVRASILATEADVVAGALANRALNPRVPLTVDLTVHGLAPVDVDRLTIVSRPVKVGRSTVVVDTWFCAPGAERPLAFSQATFMPSPRPVDVLEFPGDRPYSPPRLAVTFPEHLGIRVARPGVAELDRVEYVMQPTGTIQGGALAALAEVAAETLAAAPVTALDVRYLKAVRVGPARATAELIGSGVVRVEVRDAGNGDRLATVALARTSP